MTTTTDGRELMARAQAGDVAAFSELYTRHRGYLARYAENRLPGQGDDIAQDTFVRALRSIHRWTDQGFQPLAWLKTIASRIIADRIRDRYHQRVTPDADAGHDVAAAEWQVSPEHLAIQHQTRVEVLAALAGASEAQREAIVMFHLRGMRIAAIGEAMGRSEGAVKALLYKGRAAMGRQLEASR